MRGAVVAGLLAVVAVTVFMAGVAIRVHGPSETLRLTRENTRLKSQLGEVQHKVRRLNVTMDALSGRDGQFRLVAGLEPLPEEVQRAGIGGPDDARVERNPLWQVDRAAAASAHVTNVGVGALLRRAHMLSVSWREARDTLKYHHERLAHTPSIQPTEGYISSAFSRWRFHPDPEPRASARGHRHQRRSRHADQGRGQRTGQLRGSQWRVRAVGGSRPRLQHGDEVRACLEAAGPPRTGSKTGGYHCAGRLDRAGGGPASPLRGAGRRPAGKPAAVPHTGECNSRLSEFFELE